MSLIAMAFVSCDKDDNNSEPADTTSGATFHANALVLNEGGWGANNASISALDTRDGEIKNGWFADKNRRGLGDVAQDMLLYGSKVYVTVTFSNSLEVIDTATGISQRIDMGDRQPRSIAAAGGKLYISCYTPHSVVRIDTASLQIEATCTLGEYNPEGLAIEGDNLFVTSSFISDQQNNYTYDDKLYVIPLSTFANPQTITVGANMSDVQSLGNGKLIATYTGDYAAVAAGSAIIDAATLTATPTGQALTKMAIYNGKAYGYATEYDDNWNQVVNYVTIDANGTVAPFPVNFSLGGNPYGISIDPANGDIYIVSDGNYTSNGDLYCISLTEGTRFMTEAGMLPKKVVFLK